LAESFDPVDDPVEGVDEEPDEDELVSEAVPGLLSAPADDFAAESPDMAFFRASDG
jgi:hypothetical protein